MGKDAPSVARDNSRTTHRIAHRSGGASLAVAVTLLVAVGLPGCRFTSKLSRPKPKANGPTAAICAFFDISGSTSSPEIRKRYFEEFVGRESYLKQSKPDPRSVLGRLTGGEIVKGDKITENSQATATFPIDGCLPIYNPWSLTSQASNPRKHKLAMRKTLEEFRLQSEKLILSGQSAPSTDLMNAFQLAETVFTGEECSSAKEKLLIIFSDMVEQSDRYNFFSERLTDKRISEIVAKERKDKRLPNLNGVQVWVSGATAATHGGLPSERIHQIRDFWLEYFKACGADLPKNHYGATLVNFRLHPENP